MPRFRFIAFAMLAVSVGAVGCQGGNGPPPAMPPPQVTVAKPVVYPVQHYLEYNGSLDSVESVQIKARVRGFLKEICFREGEEVKEGDLLYKIDPREYDAALAKSKADKEKAYADIANAEAQIRLADAELERTNRAATGGAAAKSDVDKAKAQLAANKAQLDTAKASLNAAQASIETAELNLEYTTVKSPIAGRISRTQVTRGNLVGQNELTLLTTIVRMDELYVYFDVPEHDLVEYQRVRQAKGAADKAESARVEVSVATEEGFPHKGYIDFRENRVETGTGTIRIRGRLPNPDRFLYPGLYARVRIPVGGPQERPIIPEDALMTGQEGRFVYVVGDGNVIQKRTVTVGPQVWSPPPPNSPPRPGWTLANPHPASESPSGGIPVPSAIPVQSAVAIESGLKPGEVIVVNGLQKARPGAPVAPDEWELKGVPPVK